MSKVALLQLTTSCHIQQNMIDIGYHVQNAAEQGAALVVLPENCMLMAEKKFPLHTIAEEKGKGVFQSYFSDLAKRFGIWIIAGTIPTKASNGRVRATSIVFDHNGKIVASYDKIHLFDVAVPGGEDHRESDSIEPGFTVVTVDTPVGCVGLSVCYDIRFPELYRHMVLKGAQIFTVPAAFTAVTGEAHWEVLLRARAIENLCYVLAPNQCGRHENGRQTYGHSMIIDPWGKVVACRKEDAGVVTAEIELPHLQVLRQQFPCNEHHIIGSL
jgi:deaminated glutathione amidase